MINAFIWMFKRKEFVKHFTFLALVLLSLFFIFFLVNFIPKILKIIQVNPTIFSYFNYFLIGIGVLFLLGYFWELTSSIIERKLDVEAASIYNKKLKTLFTFEMPELNFFKLIWRGFASIIASALVPIPYLILINISISSGHYDLLPEWVKILSFFLFASFAPVLFWNYAKTNSIFATLNIQKAVFVMGNYPLRYIYTVIFYGVISYVNAYLDSTLYKMFIEFSTNEYVLLIQALLFLFFMIKSIYLVFVYAYGLGTLAPVSEF